MVFFFSRHSTIFSRAQIGQKYSEHTRILARPHTHTLERVRCHLTHISHDGCCTKQVKIICSFQWLCVCACARSLAPAGNEHGHFNHPQCVLNVSHTALCCAGWKWKPTCCCDTYANIIHTLLRIVLRRCTAQISANVCTPIPNGFFKLQLNAPHRLSLMHQFLQ